MSILFQNVFELFDDEFRGGSLAAGVASRAHTTDSSLKKALDQIFIVDALLKKAFEQGHITDALLKKTSDQIHLADALINRTTSSNYITDALLKKISDQIHSTDAILKATLNTSYGTDARLKKTIEAINSVDTLLKTTNTVGYTADAYLSLRVNLITSTDAVFLKLQELVYNADSFIQPFAGQFDLLQTIDSLLTRDVNTISGIATPIISNNLIIPSITSMVFYNTGVNPILLRLTSNLGSTTLNSISIVQRMVMPGETIKVFSVQKLGMAAITVQSARPTPFLMAVSLADIDAHLFHTDPTIYWLSQLPVLTLFEPIEQDIQTSPEYTNLPPTTTPPFSSHPTVPLPRHTKRPTISNPPHVKKPSTKFPKYTKKPPTPLPPFTRRPRTDMPPFSEP